MDCVEKPAAFGFRKTVIDVKAGIRDKQHYDSIVR
jgi:hypothetical protein